MRPLEVTDLPKLGRPAGVLSTEVDAVSSGVAWLQFIREVGGGSRGYGRFIARLKLARIGGVGVGFLAHMMATELDSSRNLYPDGALT